MDEWKTAQDGFKAVSLSSNTWNTAEMGSKILTFKKQTLDAVMRKGYI